MKTERSSRNALPFGTVLNGVYTVEAELGHGGVGIVYRAKHRELGPVAIKEYLPTELVVREGQSVHPVNTDSRGFFEEGLDRFLDEAKQLIRFRTHPSIVSCRDFFRANGTAYLVMDLEEGMSLSELLTARETEGRPFDETDLLTVMVPLLEGLDLVHAAGVLHRDIKPANILIRREDNHPVLIDFGAAKQEFALHSKSLAPFSPGYAAIEQVAEGRLGAWTDMYGIGAVMWRMVAGGNRPYEPLHPVRVERRTHAKFRGEPDPMPSAQTLGKGQFPQHILAAIDQCLELREADRVQGCKELVQRLREVRKPIPGIVAEATTKEVQPAERQPISHTAPNSKERHKKAIPAKRRPSGNRKVARVVQKPPGKRRIRRGLFVTALFISLIAIISLFSAWYGYNNAIYEYNGALDEYNRLIASGYPHGGFRGAYYLSGLGRAQHDVEFAREDIGDGLVTTIFFIAVTIIFSWLAGHWASDGAARIVTRKILGRLTPGLSESFTLGSHEDDVLRMQGTPKSIVIDSASGTETWWYTRSSVIISLNDRRVIDWTNGRYLKARRQ